MNLYQYEFTQTVAKPWAHTSQHLIDTSNPAEFQANVAKIHLMMYRGS